MPRAAPNTIIFTVSLWVSVSVQDIKSARAPWFLVGPVLSNFKCWIVNCVLLFTLEIEKIVEKSKFGAAKMKPRVMKNLFQGVHTASGRSGEETRVFTFASCV